MKNTLYFLTILLLTALAAHGQFDKLKKTIDKAKDSVNKQTSNGSGQADETRGRTGGTENVRNPLGKGVEAVLTRQEYNSFAEAKPNAVNRVTDGETLWLYLKFNGTLADYVYKDTMGDSEGNVRYILFTEIGEQGNTGSSYNSESLFFKKEELGVGELKLALAPGRAGRNKSLGIFLKTVGGGMIGVWKNEIRVTNEPSAPRSPNQYLARVGVICDVSEGLAKYRKMNNEYSAMVYKGSAEDNTLPPPKGYVNNALKQQILAKLKNEGITPARFYFTDNDWIEYSDSQTGEKQDRKVYSAYTYQKGAECLYGIAEAVQNYSYARGGYGQTIIYLRKDFPIQCTQLK